MPAANQLLALTAFMVAFPPISYFYTLVHLYAPLTVLVFLAVRAEKAGVILGLENYMSAEANLSIIDKVGSPAVQVYYDVGNSTDKGYDILKEIRLLGKRICEFHAKDANKI